MVPCRALLVPVLVAVTACLPDNPPGSTGMTTTDAETGTDTTGAPQTGLFACDSPCTLVLVSQTLDDRLDVFEVGATPTLRGRISLDLKPDPSGQQIGGDLLDEPYEFALTPTDLLVTVGHYPQIDQGSLLRFPRAGFAELAPGATFRVDQFFNNGNFTGGVEALLHARQEGIFLLPHPSGRVLVGVFANDLQTAEWTTPSELLVVDPNDLGATPGSFDLGSLDKPCTGAWRLEGLNTAVSKVAVACDGSDTVAVLSLPDEFASASLADAAAGITGCAASLSVGPWTTQFVAPDDAGGLLAVQSQLAGAPRLWHVDSGCGVGLPAIGAPAGFEDVHLLRQPVLLRPKGDLEPLWLVAASGPTERGAVLVQGGSSPTLCGRLTGLDVLDDANAPWALALDRVGEHLALGAGPPSNPELAEGRGQVLYMTLDRSKLDTCELGATDVVDLTAGQFQAADPSTWSRAPNVVVIAKLGGKA
jgi:hypothetical protein